MNKFRFTINALAVLVLTLAFASLAQAQATRTWVSGVGDDANPCSRTAPCKTFAGAISKTADGGEIDALDSGGFGAVTINKGITIDGDSNLAGILSAGVNGVIVNETTNTKAITLRNLSINGASTGINGIRFLAGKTLNVENCVISGFTGRGIDMQTTAAGTSLFVQDTTIHNCVGAGIFMSDTVFPGVANIIRTVSKANGQGFETLNNMRATIMDSYAQANTNAGFISDGTVSSEINVLRCESAHNNVGVQSGSGATNTIRVATSFIMNNSTGFSAVAGGSLLSGQDNVVQGNPTPGANTGTFGKA